MCVWDINKLPWMEGTNQRLLPDLNKTTNKAIAASPPKFPYPPFPPSPPWEAQQAGLDQTLPLSKSENLLQFNSELFLLETTAERIVPNFAGELLPELSPSHVFLLFTTDRK